MSVIIINEQKLNIFYDRPDFLVFSLSTMIFLNNLIIPVINPPAKKTSAVRQHHQLNETITYTCHRYSQAAVPRWSGFQPCHHSSYFSCSSF